MRELDAGLYRQGYYAPLAHGEAPGGRASAIEIARVVRTSGDPPIEVLGDIVEKEALTSPRPEDIRPQAPWFMAKSIWEYDAWHAILTKGKHAMQQAKITESGLSDAVDRFIGIYQALAIEGGLDTLRGDIFFRDRFSIGILENHKEEALTWMLPAFEAEGCTDVIYVDNEWPNIEAFMHMGATVTTMRQHNYFVNNEDARGNFTSCVAYLDGKLCNEIAAEGGKPAIIWDVDGTIFEEDQRLDRAAVKTQEALLRMVPSVSS